MNDLVHIRLEPRMRQEIKRLAKENMFGSETEFIRDVLREKIEYHRKVKILNDLRGSVKLSKTHKRISLSEAFRAVGLEE